MTLVLSLCIALCFLLFIEKKQNTATIQLMVARNVELGRQLDCLRLEMRRLNDDLIELVKENHILNIEIRTLGAEVDKLREEITRCTENTVM